MSFCWNLLQVAGIIHSLLVSVYQSSSDKSDKDSWVELSKFNWPLFQPMVNCCLVWTRVTYQRRIQRTLYHLPAGWHEPRSFAAPCQKMCRQTCPAQTWRRTCRWRRCPQTLQAFPVAIFVWNATGGTGGWLITDVFDQIGPFWLETNLFLVHLFFPLLMQHGGRINIIILQASNDVNRVRKEIYILVNTNHREERNILLIKLRVMKMIFQL